MQTPSPGSPSSRRACFPVGPLDRFNVQRVGQMQSRYRRHAPVQRRWSGKHPQTKPLRPKHPTAQSASATLEEAVLVRQRDAPSLRSDRSAPTPSKPGIDGRARGCHVHRQANRATHRPGHGWHGGPQRRDSGCRPVPVLPGTALRNTVVAASPRRSAALAYTRQRSRNGGPSFGQTCTNRVIGTLPGITACPPLRRSTPRPASPPACLRAPKLPINRDHFALSPGNPPTPGIAGPSRRTCRAHRQACRQWARPAG